MGIAAVALALGAILYWLLVVTEGTYLGPHVVILLYDWTARRYDRVKDLHYVDEARYLGLPLAKALEPVRSPWVLDVATGTGRVPLALMRERDFEGTVVAVDRSHGMLTEAKMVTGDWDGRVALIREDTGALSFADGSFDCVTCLEALEFMTDPSAVVAEMVRVLRPGGALLLSNRIGRDAWCFPGRVRGRGRLEKYLHQLGLQNIRTERWQVHYDLVWACKALAPEHAVAAPIARQMPERNERAAVT